MRSRGFLPLFWIGIGDFLRLPAIYVLKPYGPGAVHFNTSWTQDYSREIFENAFHILQDEVFLSSRVPSLARESSNVSICLDGPHGLVVLQIRKLLVSIPPQVNNLRGFDLTNQETTLFRQFQNVGYYTSLVRIPGLPSNRSVYENSRLKAPYDLPPLSAPYWVTATKITGVYQIEYGANKTISEDFV
ncbi:hypothetical protein HFD88_004945 [Aspergillus terreus]|nr:hypothetical protein HFD88_004945 [Aspergillus terreus]